MRYCGTLGPDPTFSQWQALPKEGSWTGSIAIFGSACGSWPRTRPSASPVALTLAFCIGANTALFSVVHHVLLRPLPVPEPERILLMSNHYPEGGRRRQHELGRPRLLRPPRETTVFEEQALFNRTQREHRPGRPADTDPRHERDPLLLPRAARRARAGPALHRRGRRDRAARRRSVLSDSAVAEASSAATRTRSGATCGSTASPTPSSA